MYTLVRTPKLFDIHPVIHAYKDGVYWAMKNGKMPWTIFGPYPEYCEELTRAQAFRYWRKHFPERASFNLPLMIEEALYKEEDE